VEEILFLVFLVLEGVAGGGGCPVVIFGVRERTLIEAVCELG
jgi:hypothetical protein